MKTASTFEAGDRKKGMSLGELAILIQANAQPANLGRPPRVKLTWRGTIRSITISRDVDAGTVRNSRS